MNNKICSVLTILCIVGVILGCTKQTAPTIPPTYEGTVSIRGAYLDECYSGIIRIDQDGDKVRVTVIDATESDWCEWF